MKCPRCGCDKFLEKNYEDVNVDVCSDCHGVWLDEGEIGHIIKTLDKSFSEKTIADAVSQSFEGIPKNEKEVVLNCPKCAVEMKPVNYGVSSGVIIDRCPKGHGLWFDEDELEKAQAWREYWQKEMKDRESSFIRMAQDGSESANQEDSDHSILFLIAKFFGNLTK